MPSGILISTSEAAATLTVGTDSFRNDRKSSSSRARSVEGIAVVGSAAINDSEVDLYAGDYYFGRFRNSRAGVVGCLCTLTSPVSESDNTKSVKVPPTSMPTILKLPPPNN